MCFIFWVLFLNYDDDKEEMKLCFSSFYFYVADVDDDVLMLVVDSRELLYGVCWVSKMHFIYYSILPLRTILHIYLS